MRVQALRLCVNQPSRLLASGQKKRALFCTLSTQMPAAPYGGSQSDNHNNT